MTFRIFPLISLSPQSLCLSLLILLLPGGSLLLASPKPSSSSKKYLAHQTPSPLKDIGVKERLGSVLDLKPLVIDEQGQSLALKSFFGKEPVLMTIVYYNCPSLCNFHLNGLFEALNRLSNWRRPWRLIVLSMDSREKSPLAKAKKNNYLQKFNQVDAENIHFLTGAESSIQKISQGLGFSFRWDEESKQFAHSPVAYALSPKGLISRYLYGVEFEPQTLKLSLLEAGKGKTANMIDRILLFCYRFNSEENRYSLYALNIMRGGGILIICLLLLLLVPVWIRERRKNH